MFLRRNIRMIQALLESVKVLSARKRSSSKKQKFYYIILLTLCWRNMNCNSESLPAILTEIDIWNLIFLIAKQWQHFEFDDKYRFCVATEIFESFFIFSFYLLFSPGDVIIVVMTPEANGRKENFSRKCFPKKTKTTIFFEPIKFIIIGQQC